MQQSQLWNRAPESQHIEEGKGNTSNSTSHNAVNTRCIHYLPRQFNIFLLRAPAPPLRSLLFYSLRCSIHGTGNSWCVEGENFFQSADWNCVRIKSVTFEQITRARIKWIFGVRLFQRLSNPSLGYSSNCISSRLWPLQRNLPIAPALTLPRSILLSCLNWNLI